LRARKVDTLAVDDDDFTSDSVRLSGSGGGEGSGTESEAFVSNGEVNNFIHTHVW